MDSESTGWDLMSAENHREGAPEGLEQVKLRLRNRSSGCEKTAIVSDPSIWNAVCRAVAEITGFFPPNDFRRHDSVYGFAFGAVVDANIMLSEWASFDWPDRGSISDGGEKNRVAKSPRPAPSAAA